MPDWLLVVIFLSAGMLLFLLELLTPGFGFTGVLGLIFLGMGIYFSFKELSLFWGIISILVSTGIVIMVIRLFPRSLVWRKIRLNSEISKEKGFVTSQDLEKFIGKEGITLSTLRPAGLALIEGKRLPVQSEGIFILRGKKIIVTKREGNVLIVKERVN